VPFPTSKKPQKNFESRLINVIQSFSGPYFNFPMDSYFLLQLNFQWLIPIIELLLQYPSDLLFRLENAYNEEEAIREKLAHPFRSNAFDRHQYQSLQGLVHIEHPFFVLLLSFPIMHSFFD